MLLRDHVLITSRFPLELFTTFSIMTSEHKVPFLADRDICFTFMLFSSFNN